MMKTNVVDDDLRLLGEVVEAGAGLILDGAHRGRDHRPSPPPRPTLRRRALAAAGGGGGVASELELDEFGRCERDVGARLGVVDQLLDSALGGRHGEGLAAHADDAALAEEVFVLLEVEPIDAIEVIVPAQRLDEHVGVDLGLVGVAGTGVPDAYRHDALKVDSAS